MSNKLFSSGRLFGSFGSSGVGGGSQVKTMPEASEANKGKIVQYVGETTVDYTNGYFYKCVEDTTTTPSTYSWVRVNVQPSGGSGGGIGYEDLHAISPIAYNSTNGTYSVASGYSIPTTAQTAKIDTAIQSNNVKTINTQSIIGTGNISIKTYSPFPSDFVTSGTLQQVVASMLDSAGATEGMAYLGGISGSCTPFGSGNVECKVEYMSSSIVVLTVNSADVAPYSWFYNSASYDYKWKSNILQVKEMPESNLELSEGLVVHYIGNTTSTYTNGYFYKCENVEGNYTWVQINVQPGSAGTITDVKVNGTSVVTEGVANIEKATNSNLGVVKPDGTSITIDANGVISSQGGGSVAIDDITITRNTNQQIQTIAVIDQSTGNTYNKVWTGTKAQYDAIATKDANTIYYVEDDGQGGNNIQFTSIPTPSSVYANRVIQYIGTTGDTYTKGLWYVCTETSPSTYTWNNITVDKVATVDNVGLVKPDGTTITINNGVISAQGGGAVDDVKVDGESVVAEGIANISVASKDSPGVIKVSDTMGSQILSSYHGLIAGVTKSASAYASGNAYMLISKGTLENVISDKLVQKTDIATTSNTGVVKPDGTSITVTADGTISSVSDVTDVKVNGTSVVTEGVANIPVASNNVIGVIGTSVDKFVTAPNGLLSCVIKTASQYESGSGNGFISKGTLENVVTGIPVTITDSSTTALTKNRIYTIGEATNLTVTYPASPDNSFIAELDFTSGTTPTTITLPSGTKCKGDDCTGGNFTPVASKRYVLMFYYDGVNFRCAVTGEATT